MKKHSIKKIEIITDEAYANYLFRHLQQEHKKTVGHIKLKR